MNPERLPLQSADGAQINLDMLYQIAPSCFTETKGSDGKLHRVVNFDVLRQLLGDAAVDTGEEFYQFTWPGKAEARREAARPIKKTLRPVIDESEDWDNTKNLYIEGDNLEVLKLLQKSYMGKVKMIYIDPPYNTGKDFVYNDDYACSTYEQDEAEGNIDDTGNRYRKNLETGGRFHSVWCSMIFSRLSVARSLLSEDGVIFISIDGHELVNLKKICDQIFGERNFIEVFNWAKTETPENLSKKAKQIIEYVLCYQKNKDSVKFSGIKKTSVSSNGLLNQPNGVKTLVFPANKVLTSIPNQVIHAGMYGTDAYDVELLEDTEVKDGLFIKPVKLSAKFKWKQENLEEEIKNGTIIRIPTLKFSPSYEKSEYDAEVPSNLINSKVNVDTNEVAGNYQVELFGKKVFNYPKPVSLIKYLLGFRDCSNDDEIIIMDFFSGSGTTAEAVIEMSKDIIDKPIKYILVQLQEDLYKSLASANTPSEKEIIQNAIDLCNENNWPCVITEVAKERIRRAGKKIKEEAGLQGQNIDTGFRVFRVDESNFEDVYFQPAALSQNDLGLLIDNVKPGRTDLDLLFGAMLDWGVQLSLPMQKETIDGKGVYSVNGGDLVACFANDITENIIAHIAEKSPLRVLFRDSCFKSDAVKINIFEQLKQRLDWSDEEAIKNIRVI
ncbi:MAG: site-specific DNA-methyltransferase [Muribaculaceae bacterium]|nr:site-specific DNA-methyltransferase [Muribaculaceae bacterium]